MKRINEQNINTPNNTDQNFEQRWRKQVQFVDYPRFQLLASRYGGGRYLDVGCFNSPMPFDLWLSGKGKNEIHAIDYSQKVIDHFAQIFPEIHYKKVDFLDGYPYPDNYFDYIVMGEVIEHLEDPKKFVADTVKLLKPGGVLALSTPWEETISQLPVSKEHLWAFTDQDIKDLLEPYGVVELQHYKDSVESIVAFLKYEKN